VILRRYQDNNFHHAIVLHRIVLKKEDAYYDDGFWENNLQNISKNYFLKYSKFLVGLENNSIIAMDALKRIDGVFSETLVIFYFSGQICATSSI
jgi:hypothetical protein